MTYLEDILNKVGIVSSKHLRSYLLSVALKFFTEKCDKDTQIIDLNRVFEKAQMSPKFECTGEVS